MITENLHPYHLINRLQQQIKQNPERIAFRQWSSDEQLELSWSDIDEKTKAISRALLEIGVDVQEKIGLFAHNSMAWSLTDIAVLQLRAVTVPLYATSSQEQAGFILNDASVRILFVGGQAQYDVAVTLPELCPQLSHIIVLDESVNLRDCSLAQHLSDFTTDHKLQHQSELETRIANHNLDDLFTLIYTSGTTGEPKGVMLDYRNLAYQLYSHDHRLTLTDQDVSLSFLPLSHVFERAWSFYVMHTGAQNVYLTDTNFVRQAMADIRPTVMCAVPRFYEKIYSAVF